jgi:hypothetical protein
MSHWTSIVSGRKAGVVPASFFALILSSSMLHAAVLVDADFEGSSNLPSGWTQNQVSGSVSWKVQTGSGDASSGVGTGNPGTAHGGVNNATFYSSSKGSTTQLLSPVFDSSSYVNLTLTFWHTQKEWAGDQDQLTVLYSDDGGSTWSELAQYITTIGTWTERTIILPGPSAASRIAFEGMANYGFGICLDDVQVTGVPAGSLPDLSVSATDASASETGPDTGAWTITRGGDTTTAVTVYFSFSGTATESSDYTVDNSSSVSFAAGETSKIVTLTPVDDSVYDELDETAVLTLTANPAYGIVVAEDTITISDNDVADLKVLIVGSSRDSASDGNISNGDSDPFPATAIRDELQSILSGAGLGAVNVTLLDRSAEGYSTAVYSLAQWFHYPYPAGIETSTRWPNLRGESGNDWDYVILIGDPYTMEKMPGVYAQGVATVAKEVAKGAGETVLLMPWPASGSSSTVDHYKDVVYRAGRTGGLKVAPAGLAWQDAGAPSTGGHPNADGSFIAAASIYSRLWGQSASASSYTYNDSLADGVYSTVTNAMAQSQYSNDFTFQNPFLMLGDKRRDVHFSEKGTSTEQDYKSAVVGAIQTCNAKFDHGSYSDKYSSETPADDGLGWPTNNPMPIAWNHGRKFAEPNKEYVVNTNYWQMGMGFQYQNNTWSLAVEDANDTHISQILSHDLDLADFQISQDNSARTIPWRLIWAQIFQEYPSLNPLRDGSGPHVNVDLREAVGTYMYTLYSGRCPMGQMPNPVTTTWYAEKIGYETAWRLGTGRARAPGFKVLPESSTGTNVTPTASKTLTVEFIFAPTSTVTVAVTTDDPYVGDVTPSVLTFTPANYTNAQTVTVKGVSGAAGAYVFNAVFTTSSDDPAYDGLVDSWDYMNTRPEGPVPSDIRVLGNGATIISGDTTPEPALDTDFGITTSSVTHTFVITNLSSSATVTLTDIPRVSVSGAGGHFTLSQDAGTSSLGPGASTSFDITYAPLAGGMHTARVSIVSSDTAVSNYTFTVGGLSPSAPTASTQGAISSSATSARLSGMLDSGGEANAWICWGDNDAGASTPGAWDHYLSIGSVMQETAFSSDVSDLLYGVTYHYRIFVSNDFGSAWSSADTFVTLAPSANSGTPGLISGTLTGNIDITTPNPGNGDGYAKTNMGPWRAQAGGWSGNTTYVYTGQIYFDGTDYFFVESIDDKVWLKIDGTVYINDGTWSNTSDSGLISKPAGWYDFELRMSNGSGGSGPANLTPGFQFHNGGGTSTADADNWYPEDPGDASLFRTAYAPPVQPMGVINTGATGITGNSAQLEGVLNATQAVFTVFAYWSTNNNASSSEWLADASASSVLVGTYSNMSGQSLAAAVGSLSSGVTYYYTMMATNVSTSIWAEANESFTTTTAVTTNYSVNHNWLASMNPAWSNDFEAAVLIDHDGDGLLTWQEYWAGTDPMDSNSVFRIDSISVSGTNTVLSWRHAQVDTGLPDIGILCATNLAGPWLIVGAKQPVDGTNTWMQEALNGAFYRLAVTNAP